MRKATTADKINVVRPAFLRLPLLAYLWMLITNSREIRTQIENSRPDVIIDLGILSSFLAIILSKREGIPFVLYLLDGLHELVEEK